MELNGLILPQCARELQIMVFFVTFWIVLFVDFGTV